MQYPRQFKMCKFVLMCAALFILFFPSIYINAHGTGASIEETVNGYLVDIGLSSEEFVAGELSRFDFTLIDESSGEEIDFSDVWLRINQGRKVFLATGIHRPELGQTGISYVFPEAGEYEVSVRYQKDGESLAEHTFPVTVTGASGSPASFADKKTLGAILGTAVVGVVVGFIVGRKRII